MFSWLVLTYRNLCQTMPSWLRQQTGNPLKVPETRPCLASGMNRRHSPSRSTFLHSFRRHDGGGVAIIFALASIPLLMAAGMAIDYSVNSNARQEVQNAVDAAALSLAKLPLDTSETELKAKGDAQVKLALSKSGIGGLVVTTVRDGDYIRVGITGNTPTSLTQLLGHTQLALNVTSTAKRSTTNLELALVLDNTGSMKGPKLTNLKAAATDLVDNLFKQTDPAKPNALKIGIVPFSMTVNLGPTAAGSDYLDLGANSSIHKMIFKPGESGANRFTLFTAMKRTWAGCVESRPTPYDVDGTPPSSLYPDTLFVPFFAPDESDNDTLAVNSYMDDLPNGKRDNSLTNRERQGLTEKYSKNTFKVGASDRQGSTGYLYGPNAGCEIQPLTRLTTSKSTVLNAITAMSVSGDTNVPIGLAWGWHLLSPFAPFRDGVAYDDLKTKKFIVLMTDGQNQSTYNNSENRSYYSGIGYIWQNRIGTISNDMATRSKAMDDRLSALCANVKNSNVQVFTIRVEVTEGTNEVLKACASKASMFFDVKDSSGLPAVFKAIAEQISDLRIAN